MADIGRSTVAHDPGDGPRREYVYAEAHEALLEWGAWQRAIDDGRPTTALRGTLASVPTGYRTESHMHKIYVEEVAMATDRLLSITLRPAEIDVIVCGYVRVLPSRAAAEWLSREHKQRITHTAYRALLDEAVGRLSMAMELRSLIRVS